MATANDVSAATASKKMRFASLGEETIENILKEKDSVNTRRATDSSVKIFKEYLREKGMPEDFETLTAEELDKLLCKFYMEARNKKGELYKKASLTAFRHGINRYLKDLDIVNGQDFKSSRDAFMAMSSELKRQGLGGVNHHPPIEKADLQKLYASFDLTDPASLQQKVFVDILLYFGRRGRENVRDLKVSDFSCTTDSEGHMFVYLDKDEQTKNHRNDTNSADGRMYEVPDSDERCPVKTFVRYKKMLPFSCPYLFPKVRKEPNKLGCYFDMVPMGHNKLGGMMAFLSEKAGLSRKYTNHCLRATSVHLLDCAQIPTRHIMTVTGHKAESSLKTYTGYTDGESKRKMSNTISESLGISESDGGSVISARGSDKNCATCINDIDVENVELKPLSNSQMDNLVSNFDDDEFNNIISSLELPDLTDLNTLSQQYSAISNCNVRASVNLNHHNMPQLPFPTINAQTCNVVINYNMPRN